MGGTSAARAPGVSHASTTLLGYEMRRAGLAAVWSTPGVILVGGAAALVTAIGHRNYHQVVGTVLAALVPLGAAMAGASVLSAETATELQLSLPIAYRITLARRLLLVLAVACLLGLVGTLAAAGTGLWNSGHGPAAAQLVWLAPTVALAGLAVLLTAGTRTANAAAGLVAGVWVGQQAYKAWFAAHAWTHPLFLFPDVRGGVVPSADWTENRLTLLLIGLACFTVAWLLLADPQWLLYDQFRPHGRRRRGAPALLTNLSRRKKEGSS